MTESEKGSTGAHGLTLYVMDVQSYYVTDALSLPQHQSNTKTTPNRR